ncbi:hypothetical protein ALC56_02683 [Trachymyrmex septentrionalis]|uniref:Uncharacterized protein n=1 Tax=Trachymyrmex septentrionalis TaxID=34720 RepID=A0A195FQM5_9HYME|nr:hypothetical protein ALC56_02683 [Trachymyrmex septentrionalis]
MRLSDAIEQKIVHREVILLITNLSNVLGKSKSDNTSLKLTIAHLTDLYHAFEELNDELAILDPNEAHESEFVVIQEQFLFTRGKN